MNDYIKLNHSGIRNFGCVISHNTSKQPDAMFCHQDFYFRKSKKSILFFFTYFSILMTEECHLKAVWLNSNNLSVFHRFKELDGRDRAQ